VSQLSGLRMIRLFRLFRLMRLIKALNLILEGFFTSMASLSWTFLIIGVVIWAGAVVTTEGIGNSQCCFHENPYLKVDRFGSVFKSSLTLMQVMTFDSWCERIAYPISEEKPHYGFFFVCFVLATGFGFMNMMIAVIVEGVQRVSQEVDHDEVREISTVNMRTLQEIFKRHAKRDKVITGQTLQTVLASPGVDAFLKEMCLRNGTVFPDRIEVQNLFNMCGDQTASDEQQTVDINDFVNGMMRCCHLRPIDSAHDHFRIARVERMVQDIGHRMEQIDEKLDTLVMQSAMKGDRGTLDDVSQSNNSML
jgi:hypothetical protein